MGSSLSLLHMLLASLTFSSGNDTNVPVWHTREYVSSVLSWNEDAAITYVPVLLNYLSSLILE